MSYLVTNLPDQDSHPQVKYLVVHPQTGLRASLAADQYKQAVQLGKDGWYIYRVTTQWERICTKIDRALSESTGEDKLG